MYIVRNLREGLPGGQHRDGRWKTGLEPPVRTLLRVHPPLSGGGDPGRKGYRRAGALPEPGSHGCGYGGAGEGGAAREKPGDRSHGLFVKVVAMSYYIDAEKVSLDDLQKRIEETDLVPSRGSLLEDIDGTFLKLKAYGFVTLADLRKKLKSSKNIPALSKETGIDTTYLTLLRREVESYFPKPCPTGAFDWFQKNDLDKLESRGLKNTALLYDALASPEKRAEVAIALGVDADVIDSLYTLADLTRIQWVSPTAARMLVSAGYKDVKAVCDADPEGLCSDLDRVNKENKYFKGTIGLRDVRRLVKAASYLS